MPTWAEVKQWTHARFRNVADELSKSRKKIEQQADELESIQRSIQSQGETADALREAIKERLASANQQVGEISELMMASADMADAVWDIEQRVLDCEQEAQLLKATVSDSGTVSLPSPTMVPVLNPYGPDVNMYNTEGARAGRLEETIKKLLADAAKADLDYVNRLQVVGDGKLVVTENQASVTQGLPDRPEAGWSATRTAIWWNALDESERERILAENPGLLGNLDGIDMASRDKANKKVLPKMHADAQADLARVQALYDDAWKYAEMGQNPYQIQLEEAQQRVADLKYLTERVGSDPQQHLLVLENTGPRIKAAVSLGDVDKAAHVATFTPGMGSRVSDMENYVNNMRNLRQETSVQARIPQAEVATVVWIGYHAPPPLGERGFMQVASAELAEKGAPSLVSFAEGIQASRMACGAGDPHQVILGHSYGSMLTGMAMSQVRPGVVDDLVMFGSPGSGVQDAREYNVPVGHAWVSGVDSGDAVQGIGPDWSFGKNPMDMAGIRHLSNEAPAGDGGPLGRHSVYLEPGSGTLKDFARVVGGVKQ